MMTLCDYKNRFIFSLEPRDVFWISVEKVSQT